MRAYPGSSWRALGRRAIACADRVGARGRRRALAVVRLARVRVAVCAGGCRCVRSYVSGGGDWTMGSVRNWSNDGRREWTE